MRLNTKVRCFEISQNHGPERAGSCSLKIVGFHVVVSNFLIPYKKVNFLTDTFLNSFKLW